MKRKLFDTSALPTLTAAKPGHSIYHTVISYKRVKTQRKAYDGENIIRYNKNSNNKAKYEKQDVTKTIKN